MRLKGFYLNWYKQRKFSIKAITQLNSHCWDLGVMEKRSASFNLEKERGPCCVHSNWAGFQHVMSARLCGMLMQFRMKWNSCFPSAYVAFCSRTQRGEHMQHLFKGPQGVLQRMCSPTSSKLFCFVLAGYSGTSATSGSATHAFHVTLSGSV